MYAQVLTAAILGVSALPVRVEADVSNGLPQFTMVGFLTNQVREAQDRVRTALRNSGVILPPQKITINLSPADIRKEGTRYDLPIAAAILAATGNVDAEKLDGAAIAGELSLDGSILPITGVLAMAMLAKQLEVSTMLVPVENVPEARLVEGISVVGVRSLKELMEFLENGVTRQEEEIRREDKVTSPEADFADIHGQKAVKRAALIAAAGFHNLLMVGPPGTGKSMIARRIPSILPPLTKEERLEIARIHSIAGTLPKGGVETICRPFRAPHHSITPQALAGGGVIPRPGEITLAHRGVLFLDEMPEFQRSSLELLRQPLEEREILIVRSNASCLFPASFLLVGAMNPCPCGYFPDREKCSCGMNAIAKYMRRISGPLLDRFDLSVNVRQISYEDLAGRRKETVSSAILREKVVQVSRIQEERFRGSTIQFNAEIPSSAIVRYCEMTEEAARTLKAAFSAMQLSARAYHRVLRCARTIADLEGADRISEAHVTEALLYKISDLQTI